MSKEHDESLVDGFHAWWEKHKVTRVLNPAGVARMVWEAATRHSRNRMPAWITYDAERDVLTIHGKRYSAGLFGADGFCSPAGSVLRIERGPDEVVTATRLDTNA